MVYREVADLQEELNLFTEDEWLFIPDRSEELENFDYLFDQNNFDDSHEVSALNAFTLGVLFCTCVLVVMVSAQWFLTDDGGDYIATKNIRSSQYTETVNYVNGEEADNMVLVDASTTLSGYFGVLRTGTEYEKLSDLCSDSSYRKLHYKYNDGIETSWDSYDCRARMLKEYGSFITLGSITRIIEKDEVYYCYIKASIPTNEDIYEYINMYRYNFIKHFTAEDITEENIVRYFLTLTRLNIVSSTQKEYCIEMVYEGDNLVISSDNWITEYCNMGYKTTVETIANLVGGSVIEK